jgi:hypothetical protein
VINETAARFGTPAIAAGNDNSAKRAVQEGAAQDVRGALTWLDANGYSGAKILWGSSISANLVLKMAAHPPEHVVAVLSFSPGEYHPDLPNEVRSAVKALRIPTLIACGTSEESTARPVRIGRGSQASWSNSLSATSVSGHCERRDLGAPNFLVFLPSPATVIKSFP